MWFEELTGFLELRQLALGVDLDPALPPLLVDPDKLRLVLTQLLQNAIRFTRDGGSITLRARLAGSDVHLEVADTGIGLAAEDLERIFDKFYTSLDDLHHRSGTYEFGSRGTGLGLAIARAYVEAHGGRIRAESAGPGQGSSFHVVLPVALRGLEPDAVR